MPYIKPERREVVDSFEGQYGDLVYYYYKILVEIWKAYPSFGRYFQLRYVLDQQEDKVDADIVSALIDGDDGLKIPPCLKSLAAFRAPAYYCAVDELKRRYVDPYEDDKIDENGDVE